MEDVFIIMITLMVHMLISRSTETTHQYAPGFGGRCVLRKEKRKGDLPAEKGGERQGKNHISLFLTLVC